MKAIIVIYKPYLVNTNWHRPLIESLSKLVQCLRNVEAYIGYLVFAHVYNCWQHELDDEFWITCF